jgi:hypothetical protein
MQKPVDQIDGSMMDINIAYDFTSTPNLMLVLNRARNVLGPVNFFAHLSDISDKWGTPPDRNAIPIAIALKEAR